MAEARPCDLYSVEATTRALAGATAVVVTVPALVPRARFLQATRRAAILLALDTVVRAAETLGVPAYVPAGPGDVWIHGLATSPPPRGRWVRPIWQEGGSGVVSIQELAARDDTGADRALADYFAFLPALMRGAVTVRQDDARLAFAIPFGPSLLGFRREPSADARRARLAVDGGVLGRRHGGTFEFRVVRTQSAGPRLLTAVHGFAPRLPFALYTRTQARVHARVMNGFSRAWEDSLPPRGSKST